MGLFRRKQGNDEAVEERCPQCNEPLPEDAVECLMCGADLRAYRRGRSSNGVDAIEADSPTR